MNGVVTQLNMLGYFSQHLDIMKEVIKDIIPSAFQEFHHSKSF